MSANEFQTNRFHRPSPPSAIWWLMLFSLLTCSMSVFARQEVSPPDSVYCPLQKAWVKSSQSAPRYGNLEEPLAGICSSNDHKKSFVSELSHRLFAGRVVSNSGSEEKLFFQYLKQGKQAFTQILPFGDFPERRLARAGFSEKSGGANYRNDFHQESSELFTLAQLARPPTFFQTTLFAFQFARELKSISRNINPRSPPHSL